jgi:hypothetical protein
VITTRAPFAFLLDAGARQRSTTQKQNPARVASGVQSLGTAWGDNGVAEVYQFNAPRAAAFLGSGRKGSAAPSKAKPRLEGAGLCRSSCIENTLGEGTCLQRAKRRSVPVRENGDPRCKNIGCPLLLAGAASGDAKSLAQHARQLI